MYGRRVFIYAAGGANCRIGLLTFEELFILSAVDLM